MFALFVFLVLVRVRVLASTTQELCRSSENGRVG